MSWGTIYNNSIAALRTQLSTLSRLQEQSSSGNRVNRASDDPSDAYSIMDMASQIKTMEIYGTNIDRITLDMDQVSSSLQDVSDVLVQVEQLLTQAASETYGDAELLPIGQQINELLEQVVASANTKSVGRYIFGGASLSTEPYSVTRVDGDITAVTYQGSQEELKVPVAQGVTQTGVVVGDKVFGSGDRQTPVFLGSTGATVGTGTSNVNGDTWLTVVHTATTYDGTSGLAAGASSASSDTILGTGHKIVIDTTARTVRLDNGAAVAYTASSTDLKVTNADGDVAYLDLSGLDGSLVGTVEVSASATGKMSIDDGQSWTDVTFGADQAVTDSATGKVLYVDTRSIERSGIEPVRSPGTYNLFNVLISARDALLNTRNMTSSQQNEVLQKLLDSVKEVAQGVTASMTTVGARQQVLDNLKTSVESQKTNIQDQSDAIQNADTLELTVELAKFQSFYQLTLSSTSKVMSLSLLDYLD